MQSQRSTIDVVGGWLWDRLSSRSPTDWKVCPTSVAWLALTLCVALLPHAVQAQTVEWARSAGGTSGAQGRGVAVDAVGNSYVTGFFQDTAVFGSFSVTSAGREDAFVAKYDSSGNVLWVRSGGGIGSDKGFAIALDAGGNIYISGGFMETATFGPFALTSPGFFSDIFVVKYDGSGNALWARSGSVTLGGAGSAIAVDTGANSYVTGVFGGTAMFGAFTLTGSGGADVFVVKYDPSGNVLWARSSGGTSHHDLGTGIAVDIAGNTYVTGNFNRTTTFGSFTLTGAGSFGASDVFVAKYDRNGSVLWAQSAGGKAADSGESIAVDAAGNAYVTGLFQDTAEFGSFSVTTAGREDAFVVKYDPSGNVRWARSSGGASVDDVGRGIAVDTAGNTYVTGLFDRITTFGSFTLTAVGSFGLSDVFVAKYDRNGNVLWARSAGGELVDVGNDIGLDAVGNVYITGFYEDIGTFGAFTLTSAGERDIFVAKFAAPADAPIPAVSQWGLIVLTLLLLVGAKVYFNRRRSSRAS